MGKRLFNQSCSVIDLYPLALLEGEGMGTAYEYSIKLKILNRIAKEIQPLERLMIGGLPENYGLDLDFAMLAAWHGCRTVVVDDRPAILEAFAGALKSPPLDTLADAARFEMRHLPALAQPALPGDGRFDLWVSNTVIQRLDSSELDDYLAQVREQSRYAVLFTPNKANSAHLTVSGLDGFFLPDLVDRCRQVGLTVRQTGYMDVAPFPPGLQRSSEAKEKAVQSPIERSIMRGLEWWLWGERFMPRFLKRRFGHILYVFVQS